MRRGRGGLRPGNHLFVKGHKKLGGRKKGSANRFTRELKEMLLNVLEREGGEDYIRRFARSRNFKERIEFFRTLRALLPLQVTGKDGAPISVVVAQEDEKA